MAGLLAAAHAGANPLFVSGLTPTAAPEGAAVDIFGGGFGTAVENLSVSVWNAQTTEGASFVVTAAQASQLDCQVEAGAQPMVGELTVVRGHHYQLPSPPLLPLDGGTVVVEEVSWFIGRSVVTAPGLFEIVENGDIFGNTQLSSGHILFSLNDKVAELGPEALFRLTATSFPCDGGGGADPPPPPTGESTPCSMVQGQIAFAYLSTSGADADPVVIASDLAAIFNISFANLSYTATAEGSDLVISREGGIDRGFVSLSVCTANC